MDSTTLVTFLLQAPLSTSSVNLLGSWDNFSKAYPMQKDSRIGRGHWRGCHSFQNIICDGDSLSTTGSRDGGLMMGGKYWYYYRLDDDLEYHNPAEPFTTFCPFLPGQEVNVLDVPIEWKSPEEHSRSRSPSSAASHVCTLDPQDRYVKPRGPQATALPRRATSKPVSIIKHQIPRKPVPNQPPLIFAKQPNSCTEMDTSQLSSRVSNAEGSPADAKMFFESVTRRAAFWTAFRPFRGIRLAFTSHGPDIRCKASRGSQQRRPHTSPAINISREPQPGCVAPVPCVSNSVEELAPSMGRSLQSSSDTELASKSAHETGAVSSQDEDVVCAAQPDVHEPDDTGDSCGNNADQLQEQPWSSTEWKSLGHSTAGDFDIGTSLTMALSQLKVSHPHINDAREPELCAHTAQAATAAQRHTDCPTLLFTLPGSGTHELHGVSAAAKMYRTSSSQYTMNDIFSPSLSTASAYTGAMSPYHLSQPGTPVVNDFGDDSARARGGDVWSRPMAGAEEGEPSSTKLHIDLAPPVSQASHFDNGAFKGYSLPADEQTTSLNLAKSGSDSFGAPAAEYPLEQKRGKQLVEWWNDGSEQGTTMKEPFEDLGYLGGMIARV
ncbi:MAG: hypothetical protein FRX48_09650 [Lasallia pustulata]|uniref:Uncharacterized protein n=1 Tax=Lasallia pustulata TaxID=136370 RepID=A0A5M8PBI4_9LECA|nr:MAG: hypothetical protein FRX48_09650 [Lasallia pustulata]